MECATLTIQRKLQAGTMYAVYRDLFNHYKKNGENYEAVLRKHEEEPTSFGKIRFVENKNGVYFEHLSEDPTKRDIQQLQTTMDIPPEWLMCFSYQEMNVIGLDMGVFQAETTVEIAMERLRWADIRTNPELERKSRDLYIWLKNNARLEDRIRICSDWIYYHPEGKYDYLFVRTDINRKISMIRNQFHCPHWTKMKITA